MKLILTLILGLLKSVILLIGIAMLIGGSLCSASLPFQAFTQGGWLMLFLISIACALSGYGLIRLVTTNKNNKTMNLTTFLQKIQNQQSISFDETMAIIEAHYDYQPTEFSNGMGEDTLISPAEKNQGSCKIFAFAQLHYLTAEQTLSLFGDYYHSDVLKNPNGTDHQNIRNFIKYGWDGVFFQNQALTAKKGDA